MTTTSRDILAAARGLADDVLFPDAMRVDRLDVRASRARCYGGSGPARASRASRASRR